MRRSRAALIYVLIFVLCVVHQDFWWWEDAEPLVLGFVPIGLAWHAGISLAAALVWWAAIQFAWPEELTDFDASERAAEREFHDTSERELRDSAKGDTR